MNRKNVEDIYALSSMQQLMLLHQAALPQSEVLQELLVCRLSGALDVAALRRAWSESLGRHPALRTAIVWEGLKKPLQVVRTDVELPWQEHDWRSLPAAERQSRWEELVEQERRTPFDLTQPPLLRLALARTGEREYRFAWSCHHILLDGWCVPLVLGEVLAAYDAIAAKRPLAAPPARPFRDYIAWLQKQDNAQALAAWRKYLAGYRAPGALPLARRAPRDPAIEPQFGEVQGEIASPAASALRTLAVKSHVTMGTVVQGMWAVLLARYWQRDDVAIGVAVSGRPAELAGVESIVGPLMNNVPLRAVIDRAASAVAWLADLQAQQAPLRSYEHLPADEIQSQSDVPLGRRLFDSLVVYENYPLDVAATRAGGGLAIDEVHGTATAGFPLTLVVIPGESLALRLRYDADLLDAAAARQLLDGLITLLASLAENPRRPIGKLAFSSADAPSQLAVPPAIVDDWGLAPAGVPGTLHVAGKDGALVATRRWARRLADGMIEELGSLDDPVRVGAYRVDPSRVESLLAEHPLVEDAAVVVSEDFTGEPQLAAYLVAAKASRTLLDANESALLIAQLRTYLSERLPAGLVPGAIAAVDRLPRKADGSLDVASLPAPMRPRPETAGSYIAPRNALEAQLARVWSEVLAVWPIGVTDRFVDLGGHSTLADSLIGRMEEAFLRKLPLVALLQQPTIEHLAGLLRRPAASSEESSLVPIQPQGDKHPLFCVHPAGGTVFCYLELSRHLRRDRPLYGLQAQGIDGQAAPHTEAPEMAAHYIRAMKNVQPAGPYLIGGWSSGGILAYEVARQLEAAGDKVDLLAMFDAGIQPRGKTWDQEDFLPMLLLMFPGESQEEIEALREKPQADQLAYFQRRAELAQLVVAGAAATQAQYVFDVFHANMNAISTYQPGSFAGKVTVFRAEIHATPMHKDPNLGWGEYATGEIEVIDVPGDHITMFRDPTIRTLAARLQEKLDALP